MLSKSSKLKFKKKNQLEDEQAGRHPIHLQVRERRISKGIGTGNPMFLQMQLNLRYLKTEYHIRVTLWAFTRETSFIRQGTNDLGLLVRSGCTNKNTTNETTYKQQNPLQF